MAMEGPPHDDTGAAGLSRRDAAGLSRRDALSVIGGAAALATLGCSAPTPQEQAARAPQAAPRQPAIYLPHGGGPWPFVELNFGPPGMWDGLDAYLRGLSTATPARPRAVLVISAHWEQAVPTVSSAARPPMLYDYYGFPDAAYKVTWPAPGEPTLAADVRARLEAAGLTAAEDPRRGFDHGTFVPLALTYPAADIPTVQLSLVKGLDPAAHLAIGEALAPLRDDGVLIVGSGMSYHNMRGFRSRQGRDGSKRFDDWLATAVSQPAADRAAALTAWERAPDARACHPREEHLLPLMVIAGAGGDDPVALPYREVLMGFHVSAVHFGGVTT